MTTEGDARPSATARLWPRIRALGALRVLGIVVAVIAFAYLWNRSNGRLLEASVWQVPLILQLLVLSLPWRTISAGLVARFFFIGFGPVFLATVVSQSVLIASPLQGWVRDLGRGLSSANIAFLGNIHATVWAPITEEAWKIVPLLLLLRWGHSHLPRQGGPLDYGLLAAAAGAGMGFAEDLNVISGLGWTTPGSPLLGLGAGTLYIALVINPFSAFPLSPIEFDLSYQGVVGILLPSVENLQTGAIWAGHGGLPLAVGLAIGFAALGRRRLGRVVYLLPVVILAWATFDHFVGNWYRLSTCTGADAPSLCALVNADLRGGILPAVAIGGWIAATILTRRTIARATASGAVPAVSRGDLSTAAYRSLGPAWPARFAADVLRFLRLRTRISIGEAGVASGLAAGVRGSGWDAEVRGLAAVRIEAATLARRLRGEQPPEGVASHDELLARLRA